MATKTPHDAFIAEMNKKQKEISEVAKEEVGGGFLQDSEIIDLLELDSETKSQFRTVVSRVRCGLDKNKAPYMAFNYSILEGRHAGITVSDFVGLGGRNKEERTKRYKKLCGILQRLDFDTTKWKQDQLATNMVKAVDKLNSMEPRQGVTVSLSTWGDDNDRLNIDLIGLFTPSVNGGSKPSDDSSDNAGGDSYAAMGKEADADGEASHAALEAAAEEHGIEISDDDSWEQLGEKIDAAVAEAGGSEENEGVDFVGDNWVGWECQYDSGDGVIDCSTTKWDEDSELFTLEDENGEEYEAGADKLDFGQGWGVLSED